MFILDLWGSIRSVCLWFDMIAFSLLDNVYDIFASLAKQTLISDTIINEIVLNIYVLVGVFALFRIAVLLINSMISPDALSKKGAGLSRIFVNTVIMIVLFVLTPKLFSWSREISNEIVDKNYVQRLFVNTKDPNDSSKEISPGKEMQRIAIGAVITPNEVFIEDANTMKLTDECNNDDSCAKAMTCLKEIRGDVDPEGDDACVDGDGSVKWSKLVANNDAKIGGWFEDKEYAYNYKPFILTIIGWLITYIFLSFSFDVGKRMIELAILEILSPLFIATIVDPKSMQSGPFKKWLKAVGTSYASLFLRQAAVAIIILCTKILMLWDGTFGQRLIVLVATLIFCKSFPKWISNMIGIDGDGTGLSGLSIGKKLGGAALIGGAATKAGHAATGAVAGAASMIANNRRNRNAQRKKVREDTDLTHGKQGRQARQAFSSATGGYFAGRRQLHKARKDAYQKAGVGWLGKDANNTNKKGNPKSAIGRNLGQIGASLAIGAITGGKAGLKASDMKGVISGAKGAAKQYGQSLGFQGKTLSETLSSGLDEFAKKRENSWGTETQRFEARENAELIEKTKRFRASGTNYTHGSGENQIAVGVKEARQVMDAKLKGGASFEIKSDNDALAKQFAVNQGCKSVERVTEIKEGKEVVTGYKFENASGSIVQKSTKEMETSCGGIMTPEGVANFLKSTYTAQQNAVETYNDNVQAQANAVSSYNQARTNAQNSADQFNKFRSTNSAEINAALLAAGLTHGLSELGSNILSSIAPLGRAIEKLSTDYESASGDAKLRLERQINLLSELKQSAESNKLFSENAITSREQLENITLSQQKLSSIVRTVEGYTEAEKIQTLSRKISDIDKRIEAYKKEGKKD